MFENQTSYYILLYAYKTIRTVVQIYLYVPVYLKSDIYSELLLLGFDLRPRKL